MTSSESVLRSYVSTFLASRLLGASSPPGEPGSQAGEAAVLFADIAGFTPLAEYLARLPGGTEELSQLLNEYFGSLLALVAVHGGEVVTFAGDALVAAWGADGGDLETATFWAARCARAMQRSQIRAGRRGTQLTLRVGVGAGEVIALRVGGVGGRWQLLLSGDALAQMGPAARCAAVGEIVLSPQALRAAGRACSGRLVANGHMRLDEVDDRLGPRPRSTALNAVSLEAVLACVPDAVQARVAAGQDEWLSELRRVSTVFMTLVDTAAVAPDPLERVQTLMTAVQPVILECEGTLRHVVVDDKGIVLVAVFGPPPLAHRDDPVRAARAALAARSALHRSGLRSATGIATGQAFCGAVGSDLHREYAVLGDVVNLAARIMQAAPGKVLCDRQTYEAARSRLSFQPLPPVRLKGKSMPVPVYRPLAAALPVRLANVRGAPFVGRLTERARLDEHLDGLERGTGGVVAIVGEPGMGKSRLLAEGVRQATSRGIRTLAGGGESIDKLTPYHAWRPVYAELFGIQGLPEGRGREALARKLRHVPGLEARAPLLDRVLSVKLPDTPLTAQLTGDARAANTVELLVELLVRGPDFGTERLGPLLIVLDDAHWVDSASWAVARRALARLDSLLLVVASRPDTGPLSDGYRGLLEEERVDRLVLRPLEGEEAAALVVSVNGGWLPGPAADLVQRRGQGVPLFLEELTYALRDAELGGGADRASEVTPDTVALESLSLPESVQGVVAERLDRLTPASQLTLKVASVLGLTFAEETLRAVHPVNTDPSALASCLADLQQQNFTVLETVAPETVYRFRHAVTQEVAYSQLLGSQRRRLHKAVAESYEGGRSDALPAPYRLLAHHWSAAGDTFSATRYLELAGEQSLHDGAYREAADALKTALRVSAELRPPPSAQRRARWHRQLGDAYMGLGQLPDSHRHAQRALSLLNRPVPRRPLQAAGDLAGQLLQQAWHRMRLPAGRSSEGDVTLEAARAHERLAFLGYYANARTASLTSALHAVNLAETAGSSPELARGYASMGIGAGMMGLHPLARRYGRLAREAARHASDLPALAFVLMCSAAYDISVGAWPAARVALTEALELAEQLGDYRRWGELAALWSQVLYHQGEFKALREWTVRMRAVADDSGDPQRKAHALLAEGWLLLPQGKPERAVERMNLVMELLAGRGSYADEIFAFGLLGQAHLRLGRPDLARSAAGQATALIARSRPVAIHALEGYAGAAEVLLGLWEAGDRTVSSLTGQACMALHRFARAFPVARPRALLCRGLANQLAGRSDAARAAWDRSLTAAEHLEMPYECARAHLEIGRHLPLGTPGRPQHLGEARRTFTRLGAAHELTRTQDAVGAGPMPSDR